jgi:phenylglyoxylate dehydrogenase beta subunit
MFNTLVREYNRCPPNCSACEEACAKAKGNGLPLIRSVHIPEAKFHGVMTCHQCHSPSCLEVCPTAAITRGTGDGIVRIDESKCAGCGLCTLACPYGCIYYGSDKEQATKCDLCGGKPKCVEACKYNALSLFDSQTLHSQLDKRDLLAPGVTLCAGCTVELASRTTYKVLGHKDIVYFSAPGCNAPAVNGAGWSGGGSMSTLAANSVACMMTNIASTMTGVSRYFRKMGKDIKCVCFVGDGATADIGFQSLSGAAERDENIIYICYDNEAYMNTGVQRSSTTPSGPGRRPPGSVRKAAAKDKEPKTCL